MARTTGQDVSDGLVARGRTVDDDEYVDPTAIPAAGRRPGSGPARTRWMR